MSGEHLELYTDLLINETAVRALLDGPWGDTHISGQILAVHCPICQANIPWGTQDETYPDNAAVEAHKDYHIAMARLLGRALSRGDLY